MTARQTSGDEWHIVTCEYPPTIGGVSDYSYTLACELSSTFPVHVWCPATTAPAPEHRNVTVHALRAFSSRDLRWLDTQLDACPGRRQLFVQWVPQGFGYRSLNLGFASWVARRARKGDRVHLMVHEPFLSWSVRPLHLAASLVHRAMLTTAARRATRVWVSTSTWKEAIRPYVPSATPIDWLPVPAPRLPDAADSPHRPTSGDLLVGHFGTHAPPVREMLTPALEEILRRTPARILLMGRDSDAFCETFLRTRPAVAGRVEATGALPSDQVAPHLRLCDVMLQPYPDGITTRRTSALTLLSLGLPMVTNRGPLTEAFWHSSGAVRLAAAPDAVQIGNAVADLLGDAFARAGVATRARELYEASFAPRHAVALLTAEGVRPHAA